jgi:squalene-associated FAD-dependent desaturase
VAVVGGGLAGLAAALDLVDADHRVTVYEARPTLGGAVQTLPERDGDPSPPPDNGQHIALGCCTAYLAFLERVGSAAGVRRERLSLPVFDERGRVSSIGPGARGLLGYQHVSLRDRIGIALATTRLGKLEPAAVDDESFGALLRRLGSSDRAVERFWDVFVRPALNLRCDEASAALGVFTVQTALLGPSDASDLILPIEPLGAMHGDAAGRALEAAGAALRAGTRVDSLEDLDADAVVLAVPPRESARLLGEPEPELEDSPIVSVHLLFDRTILDRPLAALLESPAHWVFDRGRLTGHEPERGQYLTVVSSGAPELLEVRGRDLVELMAGELIARFGGAELVWSRLSREPAATFAGRPGTAASRPGPATSRAHVFRAGAWTDTGWPATMEGAVRSGHAAAQAVERVEEPVAA